MAQELESRGYIARTDAKIKLRQPNHILEDWVREYSCKKSRRESYFCLAKDPEVILEKIRRLNIPENLIYVLGLHAGAGLVAPHPCIGKCTCMYPVGKLLIFSRTN